MSLRNKLAGLRSGEVKKPILCYVTDRHLLEAGSDSACSDSLLDKIEALAAAGVDWIQLREKDLSGKASAQLTRDALRRLRRAAQAGESAARSITARETVSRFIVNDRLDVALAERSGGVHLGESSLPVAEARRLKPANRAAQDLPEGFLLGVSCHSLDSAKAAEGDGADYLFFGPVFSTPSKAAYGPAQGMERLHEVCAAVGIPVLAIGGITLDNAGSCLDAGASGIAAIRLFQDASDPAAVVRSLRSRLDRS